MGGKRRRYGEGQACQPNHNDLLYDDVPSEKGLKANLLYFTLTPGFVALICILAWVDLPFCWAFLLTSAVHELGHLAALLLCGAPILGIRLGLTGAVIDVRQPGYGREVVCAAAGPVTSLLLAIFGRGWGLLATVSLCLGVYNLLPLYPLDGGRILRALLHRTFGPDRGDCVQAWVTAVTACALMLLAAWATVVRQGGLWPMFAVLAALWKRVE